MPGNQIGQNGPVGGELLFGQQRARVGVGLLSRALFLFEVSLWVIARFRPDAALKSRLVFAQVVPEAGKIGPVTGVESIAKGPGQLGHVPEVFFEQMFTPSAGTVLPDVCEGEVDLH